MCPGLYVVQLAQIMGVCGFVALPKFHMADVTGRKCGACREHDALCVEHGVVCDRVVCPLPAPTIPVHTRTNIHPRTAVKHTQARACARVYKHK